ncbi:MAG: ABC transporter permease [Defluviitaleaceae bacterium]|nr:ABC transporter permease [Defluviitaleaceae bacterium]
MRKLTIKLASQHLKNTKRHSLWTLVSIVLAVGMLVAIGGFGTSAMVALNDLTTNVDGWTGGATNIISYGLSSFFGGIVAFAGIVVISNAFRISAGERTRQFGILKSVGATKKHIKATVLAEATILSAIGIPLGFALGFLMYYLSMAAMNIFVDLNFMSENLQFSMHFQPIILLIALILSLIVIFTSAWLPARKAAKTPAINAIRGIGEVKKHTKRIGGGKIVGKIFGFEGLLAAKTLRRNRKHFRATVISISVSLILILTAVSLNWHMTRLLDGRMEQIDMPNIGLLFTSNPNDRSNTNFNAATATKITEELQQFADTRVNGMGFSYGSRVPYAPRSAFDALWIMTLNDTAYTEIVELAGVPYGSNVLVNVRLNIDTNGVFTQERLFDFEDGDVIRKYSLEGEFVEEITVHGQVLELPRHLYFLAEGVKTIVMPDGDIWMYQWNINTAEPEGFASFARDVFESHYILGEYEEFTEMDWTEGFLLMQAIVSTISTSIAIFSTMLALLGLTNVISTIVTSIQMRKREFAVLTSIGMDKKGLRNMLALESILSSARALLFGLPLGFAAAYVVYLSVEPSNPVGMAFYPPFMAMAICTVAVFAVTFVIMQAAIGGIKKDSVIDTIRGV